MLGADRAIWPSAAKSSLTLTCAQMISADDNDRGMGAFAATVIGGADPEAPLANLVRQALEAGETDDPLSTLAWPLLNQTQTEVPRRVSAAVTSLQVHAPDYLAALREASACLATHEASQGNRLRTLQRAVHFACLTAQSHAQALVAGGDLEARPPALIAFRSHKNAPLTLASEASLSQIYDAFEAWLRSVLAERLRTGQPLHGAETIDPALVAPEANADRLSAVVLGLGGAGRGQGPLPDRLRDARLDDLREGLSYFPSDRADALAHALWNIYRRENTSGGPREFLQRIGRWSGLIYPHFQGASREKRIRPSIAILDLLARSCVAAGESIPLDAFLERLWRRFGLIVGGPRRRETDAAFLRRFNLDLDANRLVENTEVLVDLLSELGLARRYADDMTFVGDGHVA